MCNDKQAISVIRGTTNTFTVYVADENGDPYTLAAGEVLRFGVKAVPGEAEYILTKIMTSADAEGDGYVFTILPSDTAELGFGSYWYDIGLQSGNNYFNVVPASGFNILYNVTEAAT